MPPIDHKKLKEYRKLTTISGVYMDIWAIALEDSRMPSSLENYLVSFYENEEEFIIKLIKPRTEIILGGGHGLIKINKDAKKITTFTFAR